MTEVDHVAQVTADDFEDRVDSAFQFVSGQVSMDVELVQCKLNPDGQGPDCDRVPFNLMFRAEENPAHPMQQVKEFLGELRGLDEIALKGVYINRTLRPVRMPPGAYYQLAFS